MPLAKCIRRCWDSQATKRYYPGDIADFPEDHVFIKGKIKCFEIVTPDQISKTQQDTDAKIIQMAQMIADLKKRLDEEGAPPEGKTEAAQEEKRGPGNPNWKKKE